MEFHDKVIKAEPGTMFTSGGLKIGALVEEKEFPNSLEELELPEIEIEVVLIPTIWDLVNTNEKAIELDYSSCFGPEKEGRINKNAVLIESASIFVGAGAKVHAGVVLDASEGPIIIDEGAVVRPGAFVEGPCYIGKDTTVVSGWIRPGCSFGRACRVGGEVEASIFQGYSNKYHEGFIGHSYIGEWVNLGALTTTSDLKNNYSEVHVDQGEGPVATGQMKVGSFIGDHTKTGIGTLLNTGTCIGVNVNHYGTGFPPKHIRSFSWGTAEGYKEYTIEKAMETARMVMSRREVEMLPEEENLLRFIHSLRK